MVSTIVKSNNPPTTISIAMTLESQSIKLLTGRVPTNSLNCSCQVPRLEQQKSCHLCNCQIYYLQHVEQHSWSAWKFFPLFFFEMQSNIPVGLFGCMSHTIIMFSNLQDLFLVNRYGACTKYECVSSWIPSSVYIRILHRGTSEGSIVIMSKYILLSILLSCPS